MRCVKEEDLGLIYSNTERVVWFGEPEVVLNALKWFWIKNGNHI